MCIVLKPSIWERLALPRKGMKWQYVNLGRDRSKKWQFWSIFLIFRIHYLPAPLFALLERHEVLWDTGVLPSLVGRPPESVDALHCTRPMRPHAVPKQPVSRCKSNPVGLAAAGPKLFRPPKLATLKSRPVFCLFGIRPLIFKSLVSFSKRMRFIKITLSISLSIPLDASSNPLLSSLGIITHRWLHLYHYNFPKLLPTTPTRCVQTPTPSSVRPQETASVYLLTFHRFFANYKVTLSQVFPTTSTNFPATLVPSCREYLHWVMVNKKAIWRGRITLQISEC